MKKFFAMTLCVIMVFGLVACDSNPGASIPEGGIFTQPEETTVMSREDAVKTVEKYYKKVGVNSEDLLVSSDTVLDESYSGTITVVVADSHRRESVQQRNKLFQTVLALPNWHMYSYLGLVLFDSSPHIKVPVTHQIEFSSDAFDQHDKGAESILDDNNWDDNSAAFDAVVAGLKMLTDAQEYAPSATLNLVLISSGGTDTSRSVSKAEKIIQLANGLCVRIHTVAYAVIGNEQSETLRKMAESTGGEYLEADTKTIQVTVRDLMKKIEGRQ